MEDYYFPAPFLSQREKYTSAAEGSRLHKILQNPPISPIINLNFAQFIVRIGSVVNFLKADERFQLDWLLLNNITAGRRGRFMYTVKDGFGSKLQGFQSRGRTVLWFIVVFSLIAILSRVTFLIAWAIWCGRCSAEEPLWAKLIGFNMEVRNVFSWYRIPQRIRSLVIYTMRTKQQKTAQRILH